MIDRRMLNRDELLSIGIPDNKCDSILNSKQGWIQIKKKSSNPGYFIKNDGFEGETEFFGEGIRLRIHNSKGWFITSTIKSIDWELEEFTTENSVYKFYFVEK